MDTDLDTFLTTVYVIVDDLYRTECAPHKPPRPGHRPELTDSEVLTLGILAQWQRSRSERAFLRAARPPLAPYFPRFLSQSAFNRRLRALGGVLAHLVPAIASRPAPANCWGPAPTRCSTGWPCRSPAAVEANAIAALPMRRPWAVGAATRTGTLGRSCC